MGLFGPPNVKEMKAGKDVKGLIKALGYKKDQAIVQAASLALAELGSISVQPLTAALENKDATISQAAKETLIKIGEPAVEALIAALRKFSIRKAAADVLVKIGGPALERVIDQLVSELLGEKDDISDAANALIDIGAPAIKQLTNILMDKSIKKICKKTNAMIVCMAFNMDQIPYHTDLLKQISEVLNNGFNLRGIVAAILGKIGDASAVDPLLSALKDEDTFVHWAVAGALFKIGDDKALEPLINHLVEEDILISGTGSIWVLIGDGKTIKPMLANLKSEDQEIVQPARETLKKMGWHSEK